MLLSLHLVSTHNLTAVLLFSSYSLLVLLVPSRLHLEPGGSCCRLLVHSTGESLRPVVCIWSRLYRVLGYRRRLLRIGFFDHKSEPCEDAGSSVFAPVFDVWNVAKPCRYIRASTCEPFGSGNPIRWWVQGILSLSNLLWLRNLFSVHLINDRRRLSSCILSRSRRRRGKKLLISFCTSKVQGWFCFVSTPL